MNKKKKTTKKKIKSRTKTAASISSEAEYIAVLMKYTERNITNDGSNMDLLFKEQFARLKKQLEEAS